MGLHAPDPVQVSFGVQTESACRADRSEDAIPALPRAEHMVADAETTAEFADAQYGW
jgi:hypothetical protein